VRTRVPWAVGDAIGLYLGTLAGLVMIFVAWYNASGSGHLATLVAWTNLGVGGIIVSGTANALWLLSGRRAVGERRRWLVEEPAPMPDEIPQTKGLRLLAGPGMTRFHLENCPLVVGKAATAASRQQHVADGRRPCGVCEP
jgi:hypothetical protein